MTDTKCIWCDATDDRGGCPAPTGFGGHLFRRVTPPLSTRHVDILREVYAMAGVREVLRTPGAGARLMDIQEIVRALASRPYVLVNVEELETTATMLAKVADGTREDTAVFSRLYDLVHRLLSPHTTPEKP